MDNQSTLHNILTRDGTSQAERIQAALNPDYVSVDERSVKDLLAFAQAYAKKLRYFDVENDEVVITGDWQGFLGENLDPDDVLAFIKNPELFTFDKASQYTRPHFALFLTFLQLLTHAQTQINKLTQRHLEYYYEQILQMSKRAGIPDRVNVLVDLTSATDTHLLQAGTLLNAGVDSQGQGVVYSTEQDIVVNKAEIAQIKSLFVDQEIIGIREEHKRNLDQLPNKALMAILKLALGDPQPGDDVFLQAAGEKELLTETKLQELENIINFLRHDLYLDAITTNLNSNYSDFRTLMKYKKNRDNSGDEWAEINKILEQTGKNRTKNKNFQLSLDNPKDFNTNLKEALGLENLEEFGNGIRQVDDVYDLYELRVEAEVQTDFKNKYPYWEFAEFVRMMQIKVRIDAEWAEIFRILNDAMQRRIEQDNNYIPPKEFPVTSPEKENAFNNNLEAVIGANQFTEWEDIDGFYTAFQQIKDSFYIMTEFVAFILRVKEPTNNATVTDWDRVYALLAEAHTNKVYADRRRKLQSIHTDADDPKDAFDAIINFAVGNSVDAADSEIKALDLLLENISNAEDAAFLSQISQRVHETEPTITDEEWDRVYQIVEAAQRTYQNLPLPVAQKIEWLNLFPTEDARTLTVSLGLEGEDETTRWRTFGRGLSDNPALPPPTSFGWAIGSPLLGLAEGERDIFVTLGFKQEQFDEMLIRPLFFEGEKRLEDTPFLIQLSTEDGWVIPNRCEFDLDDYYTLCELKPPEGYVAHTIEGIRIKLTIDVSENAIAPLLETINPELPLMQLLLRPFWNEDNKRYETPYKPFQLLELERTHLKVAVKGLLPSHLQNDQSTLTPGKPFEPFGNTALAGSRFYIGHPELARNALDKVTFNVEWMGAPTDFSSHYGTYPGSLTNSSFKTKVSLIDKQKNETLSSGIALFNTSDATKAKSLNINTIANEFTRLEDFKVNDNLLQWERYLQWELNSPDFQQAVYPALAVQKSLELSVAIAQDPKTVNPATYQVNPPYLPKIKSLTINYDASVEIDTAVYNASTQSDHIFHIEPFGYREIESDTLTESVTFLPTYQFEGELYIGIGKCQPPQNLSLLFQVAEGSADPDLEPVPVTWSFLDGNHWISLEDGRVLRDTTRGLINSGIITFDLKAIAPSTLLPDNLYWIRASISHNSRTVADTVAIHAQAVSAIFVDQNNAPDHLSQPLPAESIKDLGERQPAIKAIRQPYTSFGGKMPEASTFFYTRISERLRHKQRAVTMWDYEHLILERFPEIYKVKCLPAQPETPGVVTVIVIPDIRHKRPFDPFAPKAPANLIADISTFLADITPPSATVVVKNATYVPVKLRFGVRLREGYNEGFYLQQLNEDLRRFLSPWAYEDTAEIEIGGRIYANVLINFIEERPYVDYVAKIKLFTSEDGQKFILAIPSEAEGYWVETSRLDSVLVSARQHEIDLITETGYEEENFTGINYMKIELDFIVD